MRLARRACNWEQGERVTLDCVISSQRWRRGRVMTGKLCTAERFGVETDDGTG